MKEEGDLLLHVEVKDDMFQLKVEGKSGDLIAALLYACREEPSLANVFRAIVETLNDAEFQQKSDAFYNTQGDA
jgi:hypothetical protein